MPIPDVLIHRATLHVTADTPAAALDVLHTAEAALPRALQSAAPPRDEVIVFRRLDLRFSLAILDARSPPTEQDLEAALARAITQRIERARGAAAHPTITDDLAYFPSEASAIAEHLAALAEGRASSWPHRALTLWGASFPDVLRTCLARGRPLLGGVLAHLVQRPDAGALFGHVPADLATTLVHAWASAADAPMLDATALPADVRSALAAPSSREALSEGHRDLHVLARLFALWPPARDLRIPIDEIRRSMPAEPPPEGDLAEQVAAIVDLADASTRAAAIELLARRPIPVAEIRRLVERGRRAPRRLVSVAGGLLVWAALLDVEGLRDAVRDAYPHPREQSAVLWAIGRALEDPRAGGTDPLLLLWSGEDPTAQVEPAVALSTADPEPLHRLAIRAARDHAGLAAPLEAAPLGDLVVLTADDGFCVDAVVAPDVHDAIPELVRRFSRRAGAPPSGIRVVERMGGGAIDALLEVDVPALPEPWRAAVRAFASVARGALARRWRARAADTRRWAAIVEIGDAAAVEVFRSDAARVAAGGWLRGPVDLGGRNVQVRSQ